MSTTIYYLLALFIAWRVLEKYAAHRSASRAFGTALPRAGLIWVHPFRPIATLGGAWFPFKHQFGYYYARFFFYAQYTSTAISAVTFWDSIPLLWLSDAEAIKTIASEGAIFQKDVAAYEPLNIFGQNLVGTEGAEWKRHRKVANSAFNEASNAVVWMETTRVLNEWFEELDAQIKPGLNSSHTIEATEICVQLTLLVVASAGFGRRASWQEDLQPPPGHKLTFRSAVGTAVDPLHMFTKALAPKWIQALAARVPLPFVGTLFKETRESYDALRLHMMDLVSLSRAWVVGGKVKDMQAGLLRNLVEANMTQADDLHNKKLTDDEVLSNIFTFLLAGHETSAHTLSFAIGLMALYPDVQQRIYEETTKIWPEGCPTTASASSYKEFMAKLPYTLAVIQETVRVFTPVARLCKIAHADTSLTAHRYTPGPNGDVADITPFAIPVKTGAVVVIDILGLHSNPMYWGKDVDAFKPERFIDTESYRWPRDAFFAFAGGPRSCIGQRFALTETVCALASIVRRYKISLPADLEGKPVEEQRKLLLRWKPGVTVTPTHCVVRLARRDVL
ncbi:cytochrome P450 [Mycena filopes]|nr:cytochrome P450 [Mycena filopes]